MSCRLESAGDAQWTFCPEPFLVNGARLCALVRARLLDEISGHPVLPDAVRVPDEQLAMHVHPRLGSGGIAGLVGVPLAVFPRLASQSAELAMAVQVDGYLPLLLRAAFAAQPTFPQTFAGADLGTVAVHRRGVDLTGRVVVAGVPQAQALAGAVVVLEGLWPQAPLPGTSLAASMQQPFAVGLSAGLARDWAAGQAEPCDEVPDVANAKTLNRPAPLGSTRLRLSDRRVLAAGTPLLIDADDPGRAEVIAVQSVDTSLDDGQECWIVLEDPTRHLHRSPARVVPLGLAAVPGTRTLSRPAAAGDAVAFFTQAPPWAGGRLVRLTAGAAPPEYRRVSRYEATADGQGHFRLPLLSRLALVQLRATHASQANPLRRVLALDYGSLQQDVLLAFE